MSRPSLILGLALLLACADEPSSPTESQVASAIEPEPKPAPEPEPAADPAQQRAAAAEALLRDVDELAELHRRHGKDCPALADAIREFPAARRAALANTPASVHAHVEANEPLRLRMRASLEAVMSASMACREDPAFVAAQAELFGPA